MERAGALPPPAEPRRRLRLLRALLTAALLLAAVGFVYRDVGGFEFVNFDDPDYVTQNPAVRGGLSRQGGLWAFTSFHAANWHPLTWFSHMADVSLFGVEAGAHHLVSLALHAAISLLLFELLHAFTGAFWRAAAVSAIFALHPVQAESVAWIAERKTLLAAFWGMLTIRAYLRQAARPGTRSLLGVALLYSLSLLAKPMLVVLPLLLLLLDWWPLGRLGGRRAVAGDARRLVAEKTPLLVLSLLSGVVTIAAQSGVAAVASLTVFPLPARIANALVSLVDYLGDLFLPLALSVFYPHPSGSLPGANVAAAALALAAVTMLAWRLRRTAPFVAFGWLWYLATLLPVIGILQVGSQARADRYLYLPLIGISLAVIWSAADVARRRPRTRVPLALSGLAAGALFALAAHRQAGYWRDSRTLWEHALAVHPTSQMALYQLSEAAREQGRFEAQASHLRELLRLNPRHERALNNLGIARRRLGEKPEALLAHYEALLAINPGNVKALQNYGYLLVEAGRPAAAVAPLQRAVAAEPAYCTAINNLGRAYLAGGDVAQARRSFERAVACDPRQPDYRANLDLVR